MGNVKYYRGTEAQIKSRTPDVDGIYFSTDTNKIFTVRNGAFVEQGSTEVKQSTGASTVATMSQAAITNALAGKANIGEAAGIRFLTEPPYEEVPTRVGEIVIVQRYDYSIALWISGEDRVFGGYCWFVMDEYNFIASTTSDETMTTTTSSEEEFMSTTTEEEFMSTTTEDVEMTSTTTSRAVYTTTTARTYSMRQGGEEQGDDTNTLQSVLDEYLA